MSWINIKNKPYADEVFAALDKYGFDNEDARAWRWKFTRLRSHAPARGAKMLLNFRQYMKLASKAGLTKPSEIGARPGKYQMGRKGDTGDYTWGNCRFITMEQNKKEQEINGGYIRTGLKLRGRSKETHEGFARVSRALSGRSKETHEHVEAHAKRISKRFKVIAPGGKVFGGLNLKEFCKKKELHQGAMSAVCRGDKPQYKGWTGSYTN